MYSYGCMWLSMLVRACVWLYKTLCGSIWLYMDEYSCILRYMVSCALVACSLPWVAVRLSIATHLLHCSLHTWQRLTYCCGYLNYVFRGDHIHPYDDIQPFPKEERQPHLDIQSHHFLFSQKKKQSRPSRENETEHVVRFVSLPYGFNKLGGQEDWPTVFGANLLGKSFCLPMPSAKQQARICFRRV